MSRSTIYSLLAATPFASSLWSLDRGIAPADPRGRPRCIVAFRTEPIAPAATHAFEIELQRLLREIGRVIVQWVFNRLDPEQVDHAPLWFNLRRQSLSTPRTFLPRRLGVGTLFGTITLERIRYEPADGGVGLLSVFPLEMRLGIKSVSAKRPLAMAGAGRQVGPLKYTCKRLCGNGCTRSIRSRGRLPRFARWLRILVPLPWRL